MQRYSLTHLEDRTLTRALAAVIAADRSSTATVLAHLAEFDARRLYAPAGYPSMHAYCVGELRLSDDAAGKRIHAARAARDFPAIFAMVADGRLHLSAVVMLAPHLTRASAGELLAAATHQTRAGIEQVLVQRFPRPDVPTFVQAVPTSLAGASPARETPSESPSIACESREQHAPGRVASPAPAAKLTPLAPQRFALQVTLGQEAHDFLRDAQDLIGRGTPGAEVAEVLTRALELYVRHLQRDRFAATARPGRSRRSKNPRQVPAEVRRKVWERDKGQCTFVSESGKHCDSRTHLELDHVTPVARGGASTPGNLRLRCRAHNLHEAERVFGKRFMQAKREAATRMPASITDRAT